MLHLQDYLSSGGTPETLAGELGINVYRHPSLPLVGFKYSQTDSPKTHPVVRECRGVVLEDGTWAVVAKPFDRFFNAGEDAEAFQRFDWSDFTCTSKEDGSLMIVFHYRGEWHVNTAGSFGLGEVHSAGVSWRELFRRTAPSIAWGKLDAGFTYIFELCTTHNKVVRRYPEPAAYLLSAIHRDTLREVSVAEADAVAGDIGVKRPDHYHFSSMAEVTAFLDAKEREDGTFEGVVVRDRNGQRWKVKTKTYTALHHLHDNGNLFSPKRLVPLLLAGEAAEIVAYFPEGEGPIRKVESDLAAQWGGLLAAWREHWRIPSQKDFALAVKSHPFAGLLFTLRKRHGDAQTEDLLKQLWRDSGDVVTKKLYGSDPVLSPP